MSSMPCCVNCGLYVHYGDCLCDDCRPKVKDPSALIAALAAEVEALNHMLARAYWDMVERCDGLPVKTPDEYRASLLKRWKEREQ